MHFEYSGKRLLNVINIKQTACNLNGLFKDRLFLIGFKGNWCVP